MNLESKRKYGHLDNRPVVEGDRAFNSFKSAIKGNILPEGTLSDSRNARMENGEVETRKGCDVVFTDENFPDAYSACRYINPVEGTAEHSAIAVASTENVTIYDPEDGDYKVPYQSGQVADGDAFLVESFGSLLLFRGEGSTLPCKFPIKLGEYPLEYNGDTPDDGGVFKMPQAVVVIQIYPFSRQADQFDVDQGSAGELGETFNELRIDLAPIESRYDAWFFDEENWHITNSTLNSNTGHNFVTGDSIKLTGTSRHDGVHKIRKIDNNTIAVIKAEFIPRSPRDRNIQAYGWKENSYLRPAKYAVTTANRLAYQCGPDLIQFSDVFSPSIVNPYFNRVIVNEGAGDYITALLPVQDDSLLVFKRSSIYLITATSSLGENLRVIEVTRQMGCVSQGTVQEIGDLIYFLSDNGVYAIDAGIRQQSNIASPIQALEILNTPTSESIQNIIKQIDFAYADKFISAFWDNRYFLAVVSSGSGGAVSKILIYNQLLKSWETIDDVPEDLIPKEFVVIPDNGVNKLHLVGSNSAIMVWEAHERGEDRYFNANNEYTTTPISFAITSRSFDAESFNIKKWHRVGAAITKIGDSPSTGLSFGFSTVNPDTATLVYSEAPSDEFRKTYRMITRKVGQLFALTITNRLNKYLPAGRLRISEFYIESSESKRSTKSFSDSTVVKTSPFDIEEGFRPSSDRNLDDPVLVGDPGTKNTI
tara:strand:+ start:1351 stop:3468 length:2118 start_codon:yes stop_codon:yes gene_type:complete